MVIKTDSDAILGTDEIVIEARQSWKRAEAGWSLSASLTVLPLSKVLILLMLFLCMER